MDLIIRINILPFFLHKGRLIQQNKLPFLLGILRQVSTLGVSANGKEIFLYRINAPIVLIHNALSAIDYVAKHVSRFQIIVNLRQFNTYRSNENKTFFLPFQGSVVYLHEQSNYKIIDHILPYQITQFFFSQDFSMQ